MWTGIANRGFRPALKWGGALLLLCVTGCARPHPAPPLLGAGGANADILAPGVIHRSLPTGADNGVDLIDVDLAHAPVRLAIAAEGIKMAQGLVTGESYTPREWLDKTEALAATNGGYFGREVGSDRKEIVGLLVQNGSVRHTAPPLHGRGSKNVPAGQYVRSAFGLTPQGRPDIEWVATEYPFGGGRLAWEEPRCYTGPAGHPRDTHWVAWNAQSAVGCGPTLLHHGKAVVTDRQERLVSPGPQARTFVAYDGPPGQPRHLVLGMASGMTYRDLAAFLAAYFPRYDQSQPQDAMCLDGGASTQLSYRLKNGAVQSPRETGVTVPDAVLILPR